MRRSAQITGVVILILLVVSGALWYAAIHEDNRGILTVSFLDVGQGESTFIQAPSGRTVLIDGGSNAEVLRQLASVIPWYKRTIDAVIATHPDTKYVGGLIDVLARYKVSLIIQSSVASSLNARLKQGGAQQITAQRGQIVNLGSGAYLEILFPDRSVPNVDANVGCIVVRIVYGKTAFMLPCSAPQTVENYLVRLDGKNLQSDVLLAGSQGSKTSSSVLFVGFVHPQYAVLSPDCSGNVPDTETSHTFQRFGVQALNVCDHGTITFTSDGQKVSVQ